MSAEPDIIEGDETDEPEETWSGREDDPMAAPLSKWSSAPIVARLEVAASTQLWSGQLYVRPDAAETLDLVRGYSDVVLSLALDFPPRVSALGREVFAVLDDREVRRDMRPLAKAALRRTLDGARERLRTSLADLPPVQVEIHAYLLEGGGASGAEGPSDDFHREEVAVDPLQVAKTVTVVRLLREIIDLLFGDVEDLIPVRLAW